MVLGLLPAIRGGLGELARTGQDSRLVHGYLRPYARAFEEVRYFSYLPESLDDYTANPEVLARVRLFPGSRLHPWLYTSVMPLRYRRQFRDCAVLRVFQVTGVVPALIAQRLFGVPFVTTYGFWYGSLARSRPTALLRRAVERAGLTAAAAVIVTTEELRVHVAARVGAAKVHVIPNGVETDLFRPAPRAPAGPRRVLYVGRFSAEKNLQALVEAVAKLARGLDLELVLVGDGPERARLAAAAQRLGVRLGLPGTVDHRRLPALLAGADAFVLPSWTEGHPKALLEAMSAGVPCVASDVPGNRAVLENDRTGLLFDPADPVALARALERVLGEPALARSLGERARALVIDRYDLATLVAEEIGLLERVARAG